MGPGAPAPPSGLSPRPQDINPRAHYASLPCFQDRLGKYVGKKVHLPLKPGAKPVFRRARAVPFARLAQVDRELDRLESFGIIAPVDYSPWATPLVVVPKKDPDSNDVCVTSTAVRICGGYNDTVNPALIIDQYPLPTPDRLFAKLDGSTWFSHTDLRLAYAQLEVDEETATVLTINTHRGLYKAVRLAFGIASAPAIFARVLARLARELSDLEGITVFLDILAHARSEEELLRREAKLLERLSALGFILNLDKCKFGERALRYLGFQLSGAGLAPLPERVETLQQASAPRDVTELRSFLGHLAFYDRFCGNRATVASSLYHLLQSGQPWVWGTEQANAFQATKDLLCSDAVLMHYSLRLPLAVACDSSERGSGAVSLHILPDGSMRPVYYASKAFSPSQQKWSTFEKEFAAAVFAMTRFHEYLEEREFTLFSDHKTVVQLIHKATPTITTPRIMRGLLLLGSYAITARYRPGKENCDADCLSRLPAGEPSDLRPFLPESSAVLWLGVCDDPCIAALSEPSDLPFDPISVARLTPADADLGPVYEWCLRGWPATNPGGSHAEYYRRQDKISIVKGCLLWGERVILPRSLRQQALTRFHAAHAGIPGTQALATLHVWYPGISQDVIRVVQECDLSQRRRAATHDSPTGTWGAQRVWSHLHIDFTDFDGHELAVLVDATTGWIDAAWVRGPTAAAAISLLRSACATFGLPDTIVADNGPAFRSAEWCEYFKPLQIRQISAPPYHPESNGVVESPGGALKEKLLRFTKGTLEARLANALAALRTTPSQDGSSPARRLLGWQSHTLISRIRPSPHDYPTAAQPKLPPGSLVYFRVFPVVRYGPKWAAGTIRRVLGAHASLYEISTPQGPPLRRSAKDVRHRRPPKQPPPAAAPLQPLPCSRCLRTTCAIVSRHLRMMCGTAFGGAQSPPVAPAAIR